MNLPLPQSNHKPTMRALVVDDSMTLRRLMDLTLSPMGIELEFTDNGEDAVALIQGKHYDIVFLDVMLPGMDGYRVCKTIKADKRTKDTPVVMLTSMNSTFDKVRGIMAGTNVYLTKPLDRSQLIQAIGKCLPRLRVGVRAAAAGLPANG